MQGQADIFTKTAKGVMALKYGDRELPRDLVRALSMVDGRSTLEQLTDGLSAEAAAKRMEEFVQLEALGFARSLSTQIETRKPTSQKEAVAQYDDPTFQVVEHDAEEGVRLWAEARRGARELEAQGFYAPQKIQPSVPAASPSRLKALVVEDTASIAQLLSSSLQTHGFEVLVIGDGREAMAYLDQDELPDIVLLDVNLPGASGFDVLEHVRSQKRLALLPVVMVTTRASEDDVLRGLKNDGDGYIFKPFEWNALNACIAKILRLPLPAAEKKAAPERG